MSIHAGVCSLALWLYSAFNWLDGGFLTRRRPGKGSGGGPLTTIALVVLVVISGGLSLGFLTAKSQIRDMSLQHESISQELTYTKNHLHHVEVSLLHMQET